MDYSPSEKNFLILFLSSKFFGANSFAEEVSLQGMKGNGIRRGDEWNKM
jgi:hypothetical protein